MPLLFKGPMCQLQNSYILQYYGWPSLSQWLIEDNSIQSPDSQSLILEDPQHLMSAPDLLNITEEISEQTNSSDNSEPISLAPRKSAVSSNTEEKEDYNFSSSSTRSPPNDK